VTVTVNGDVQVEPNETFFVRLTSPSGATLGDAEGGGTITDDDPQGLSVSDLTLREGLAPSAVFTVFLSPASSGAVTVAYATANGSALAPADYTAAAGTLTFAAGETTRTVSVPIVRDQATEGPESFTLNLSNPSGAPLGYAQGTATILDAPSHRTDFDGDLRADILWRNVGRGSATGALFVWLMSGANIKGATYLDPIATDWVIQFTGDFNGDFKSDVLWRNVTAGAPDAARLYFWMMDGPVVIAGTGYPNSDADFTWQVQGVGDLDGDGNSDIVWRNVGPGAATGAMFLWLMDGRNIKAATYLDPISTDWQIQRVGDLNGDGKADILWRNTRGSGADRDYLFVWIMNGAQVAAGTGYPNSQADSTWQVQAIGDLNGDGKQDIVWRNVGPGAATGALFLWLMDGRTITGATYLDPISTDWQIQGTADFNGDGKSDILWRNLSATGPDSARLYVWMMDGPAVIAGTGYTNSQADFTWDVKQPR
jgi:hypothetical protein